jgi:hypothetical protein
MPISFLQGIIAKGLALVDAMLSNFTETPTWAVGTGTGACAVQAINVQLNACGDSLADSLAALTVNGVSLLQGMIAALGAFNG